MALMATTRDEHSATSRNGTSAACRLPTAAFLLALAISPPLASAAGQTDKVFTVANYPVEARAENAVAAKERAHADGQQAALRSLLRRLVPVTSYPQLRKLKGLKAGDLVEGLAVRSERNSAVEYLASLDFTFQARAIRDMMRREGLPYVDEQAAEVTLILAYRAPAESADGQYTQANGERLWASAWGGLDLTHTLTPLKVEALKREVHPDTVKALLNGDTGAMRIVAGEHRGENLLLAAAEADPATKRWHVTLIGQDATGEIRLRRSYRLQAGDEAYSAELAAVVSLGIIEGRWKHTKAPRIAAAAVPLQPAAAELSPRDPFRDTASEAVQPVRLFIEFNAMGQWQSMRRLLNGTRGVEALEVGSLSARGADLTLLFPGGGEGLAERLGGQGYLMQKVGNTWVLRAN